MSTRRGRASAARASFITAWLSGWSLLNRRLAVYGGALVLMSLLASLLTIWKLHIDAAADARGQVNTVGALIAEQTAHTTQALDLVLLGNCSRANRRRRRRHARPLAPGFRHPHLPQQPDHASHQSPPG